MPIGAGAFKRREVPLQGAPLAPIGIAAAAFKAAGDARQTEGDMSDAKYTQFVALHVTPQVEMALKQLAERQKTSVSDIIRQAIGQYLETQTDVVGSRSRFGNQVKRQLEEMQTQFLQQHLTTSTFLLAAIILVQMKQGTRGGDVLDQIAELAAHASDEIQAVLAGAS
jgi:hypothetical protein